MQRSFTFVCLLVVCLVCLGPVAAQHAPTPEPVGLRPDAPQYALHGPYWVGTTRLDTETDLHPARIQIWYPALNPNGAEETTLYPYDYFPGIDNFTIAGHALPDAAPDSSGGPYPLVIFVHGMNGDRLDAVWLSEHLASQGFVVAAMDQIDNSGAVDTERTGLLRRPQEVTWLIDHVEALNTSEGPLQGMVDSGRIAVTGWSLGGYTALMAGGARIDLDFLTEWCSENRNTASARSVGLGFNWCDYLGVDLPGVATAAGLASDQAGLWPSWGDPRVDAIAVLSGGFWMLFGPEGMANVTVPALVLGGSRDSFVPPDWNTLYENLGSDQKALAIFDGADHFIYGHTCEAAPWFQIFGFPCSDLAWDMDQAHDLIGHFVTTFLLTTLKSDADAAAALSSDAVSFPGIEYQAEGF